ncbi:hypothetical protein PR048_014599 [Dryococelus australis]|uniref:Uncharacterized protein n=1 Tax=Dryococelus australis TaxID=614101 RepID=A0ABQ9HEU4_9NEOP|nr:hypothetical protein PR048_014599 [Dryococelus australis]
MEIKDVLEKHIKSDSHQAAKKIFLSKTDEEKKAVELKAAINDQPAVDIVADEMSDKEGRCVFAILLRTMTPKAQQESQPPCFKINNGCLNFLKERYPFPALLFPAPVITPWNSWFQAVQYLHKYLDAVGRSNNKVDCLQMLLALKLTNCRFADAALQSVWAPTNRVDAEGFFSKYIIIVTDRHNRMTEETI